MSISWYFKALKKLEKDYKVLVHLKGERGGFFNGKHVPVRGLYPSSKWIPRRVIRDRQRMRLPRGARTWEVWIGFGVGHDILEPRPPHKLINTVVRVGKFVTR
jgi:hypothetical protein